MSDSKAPELYATTEQVCSGLRELVRVITVKGVPNWSEFYMRIPADPAHDADLVMSQAAELIEALQAERDALRAQLEGSHD